MKLWLVLLFPLLSVVLLCGISDGGEFNPVLKIGDRAPAWTELPNVDGKKVSMSDFKEREVLVVVFTCNSCPYAEDYEDRVIALAKQHAGADSKVGIVAINVNKIEDDLPPAMKAKAEKNGFRFPYLFDETQKIAKDFGATTTPEFFVLNRDRKVVYMGAMDDSSDAAKVKRNYVEEAIQATLKHQMPVKTETVPIGCLIRFDRMRRGKS